MRQHFFLSGESTVKLTQAVVLFISCIPHWYVPILTTYESTSSYMLGGDADLDHGSEVELIDALFQHLLLDEAIVSFFLFAEMRLT